jgi:hypothetical protein
MNVWAAILLDSIPRSVVWPLAASFTVLAILAALYYHVRSLPRLQLHQAAGSHIALMIGEDFAPSDRYTGFVHDKSGASIALAEMPADAFDELRHLERAVETLAAQGVTGVTQHTLPGRAGDYIYLRGNQNTQLVEYSKYVLIFREGGLTGIVTVTIPRAALTSGRITPLEIEKILKSAEVKPDEPQASALSPVS